jgi:RimJ/RimL family protein N-acetyltransferase
MIRALQDEDVEAYLEIRRAALIDSPLAFVSSPADDFAVSPERVREQLRRASESAIFGAFRPGLVGVAGLYRDRHVKAAHKARLWGMYVDAGHRRQGLGAGLLDAVLRHARTMGGVTWVELGVMSAVPGAQRLYERVGFERWGTEPDAFRHDGETVVEHHMALRLE